MQAYLVEVGFGTDETDSLIHVPNNEVVPKMWSHLTRQDGIDSFPGGFDGFYGKSPFDFGINPGPQNIFGMPGNTPVSKSIEIFLQQIPEGFFFQKKLSTFGKVNRLGIEDKKIRNEKSRLVLAQHKIIFVAQELLKLV